MSRVEWSRLGADEVESVVSLLVYREYPESVRISPSAGDGGVDILLRGGGLHGSDVVFQVKKFHKALSRGQKKSVEESLDRLLEDPRWNDLRLGQWNLILPVDPTPETEHWFQEVLGKKGVKGSWRGLTYLDALAAKYPEVVDYYLHGSRQTISDKQKEIVALFSLGNEKESLAPVETAARIRDAARVLENDPLFKYELHFGEGSPPVNRANPKGLVLSSGIIDASEAGNSWMIVDIIARCAESVNLSPVMLNLNLQARVGSVDHEKLVKLDEYGVMPSGIKFSGRLEAPGGFGENLEDAVLYTGPPQMGIDLANVLRLEVRSPDGKPLARADVRRVGFSHGSKGFHVAFIEDRDIFRVDLYTDFTDPDARTFNGAVDMKVEWSHSPNSIVGLPVKDVISTYSFLESCVSPNEVLLGIRHSWPHGAEVAPFLRIGSSESEFVGSVRAVNDILGDLETIQENTRHPVIVPDLSSVIVPEVDHWKFVASVLSDEEVSVELKSGHAFPVECDNDFGEELPDVVNLSYSLGATIGNVDIDLGEYFTVIPDPILMGPGELDGVEVIYIAPRHGRVYHRRQLVRDV